MIANQQTIDFVTQILSEEVVARLAGVRVIALEYPNPNYAAFVQPANEEGEFDPLGEAALYINTESLLKPYFSDKSPLIDSLVIHELVHVEQHNSGRLSFTPDSTLDNLVAIWEGKLYPLCKPATGQLTEEEMEAYTSLPWEEEAFKAQAEFLSANSDVDFETALSMLKTA